MALLSLNLSLTSYRSSRLVVVAVVVVGMSQTRRSPTELWVRARAQPRWPDMDSSSQREHAGPVAGHLLANAGNAAAHRFASLADKLRHLFDAVAHAIDQHE